jgi:Cu(I)/Ag(I) efflux system membrane fusion protein
MDKVDLVPDQVVPVNTPLAQVHRLDPIHVRMDFPQERLDELALGQKAQVVLDSFPDEVFEGKVIRIAPQVNPQLRVLGVVIEVPNPKERIKAGISGFVRLQVTKAVKTLPAAALLQHGGKSTVFCVRDGRASVREVRPGPVLDDGLVEARGGVAAGDEVVIFHNFYAHAGELDSREGYLQDGDLVDTDWRRWARRD